MEYRLVQELGGPTQCGSDYAQRQYRAGDKDYGTFRKMMYQPADQAKTSRARW